MIEGAIFDMDGTLLESMHMWKDLSNLYLKHVGIEVTEPLPKYKDGLSYYGTLTSNIKRYLPDMSDDEIIKKCREYIGYFYRYEVQPKKGAVEFLKKLKAMGVKICMATATDRETLEPALKRLDMLQYFSEIFTCAHYGVGKDKPDIFEISLEHLGTKKENTYIFEDAVYAIRTAKKANFPVAAVYDVNEPAQEEIRALSDIYMTDYEEFFKHI